MTTPSIIAELQAKKKQFDLAPVLENKLDIAYEMYIETTALIDSLPDSDANKADVMQLQQNAMRFMKILLNIKSDDEMIALAEQRQRMKVYDSRYLPGRETVAKIEAGESGAATFEGKKAKYNWRRMAKLAVALDNNRIMRVNEEDRTRDPIVGTHYLTHEQRAQYRIVVKDGVFYRQSKDGFDICDTTSMISHNKSGYAAYTINAQGEISIFPHHGMADHMAHSSMNAGAPVFAAGEIKIEKGKLVEMTTHSGHYQPSMENVYRTLKYFQQQGVDISSVQIRDFVDHSDMGIPCIHEEGEKSLNYYVNASAVVSYGDTQDKWRAGLRKQPSGLRRKTEKEKSTISSLTSRLRSEIDSLIEDLQQHKQEIEGRWKIGDFFRSIYHYFAGKGSYQEMKSAQIQTLDGMLRELTSLRDRIIVLTKHSTSLYPVGMKRELQGCLDKQLSKAEGLEKTYSRSDLGLSSKVQKSKQKLETDEQETPSRAGPKVG